MKTILSFLYSFSGILFYAVLIQGCSSRAQEEKTAQDTAQISLDPVKFRDKVMAEWDNKITWERMYLISEMADLPDKGNTFNRMLMSPSRIVKLLNNFYDAGTTRRLQELMEWNERYCASYIFFIQIQHTDSLYDVRKRWYTNNDQMALALSALNEEHWPSSEFIPLFREQIEKTENQIRARFDEQWDADIRAFDILDEHSLKISDKISHGLRMKFPEKFTSPEIQTPKANI